VQSRAPDVLRRIVMGPRPYVFIMPAALALIGVFPQTDGAPVRRILMERLVRSSQLQR
jgi:hypothetical protein